VTTYRAFRIHSDDRGHHAGIEALTKPDPNPGEVLVRLSHSSVNYKDALAGTGRGKILKTFPSWAGSTGPVSLRRPGPPLPGGRRGSRHRLGALLRP
jgi:acrylyl-CoA reductase (NADPH)